MKFLVCEICHQVVAKFDPERIRLPITSDQFSSPFPDERQVLSAWLDTVDAEWMMCPQCRFRVFQVPNPEMLRVSDSFYGERPYWFKPVTKPVTTVTETVTPPKPQPKPQPKPALKDHGVCPLCGRDKAEFKALSGFMAHVRFCKGKERR